MSPGVSFIFLLTLWVGQTDEAEMGFSYDTLEKYLAEGEKAVGPAVAQRIEQLRATSNHKRQMPPIAEV